jgi:integrase
VIASYVNEQGEAIYDRKWNYDILDLPIIEPRTMNRPCFSEEIVNGLALWRYPRERMIFILAAASGARISELLGLDIGQHVSSDCSTLRIECQAYRGRIVPCVKTIASYREIDLHDSAAGVLKQYIGDRTSGLLFCTANGTPMVLGSILSGHLHPALRELGFVNACTRKNMAGMHAFRRFRNTHLGKCPGLPERLQKYWMGHAVPSITGKYDKTIEDREFRKSWAQRCGIGFTLPFDEMG